MENVRILKGNSTTVPKGADLIGAYATLSVIEHSKSGPGNVPLSCHECVVESRLYSEENKK